MEIQGKLFDQSPDSTKEIPVKIEISNGQICIYPEGYGDCSSEDGYGCPVMLEVWEGKLRVLTWGDINQEDPTQITDLENAKENNRVEDHNMAMRSQDDD